MATEFKCFPRAGLLLLTGLLALILAGCKTTPKVDWNSRVGTFTYDQAVQELGPPDKVATLEDGKMVADWVTGRSPSTGLSFGTGMFGGHGGVAVGQSIGTGGNLKILRLTFGSDKKLLAWSKNG